MLNCFIKKYSNKIHKNNNKMKMMMIWQYGIKINRDIQTLNMKTLQN